MTLDDVKIIDFPKILDDRGNLSFFQSNDPLPFKIKRVYWIYDVPGGVQRGGHGYKELQEVIIALSGSFDIMLKDGRSEKKFSLNRSYYGLYIPNGIWRHIENFSTNALALIVANSDFNEDDYIRNFEDFLKIKSK